MFQNLTREVVDDLDFSVYCCSVIAFRQPARSELTTNFAIHVAVFLIQLSHEAVLVTHDPVRSEHLLPLIVIATFALVSPTVCFRIRVDHSEEAKLREENTGSYVFPSPFGNIDSHLIDDVRQKIRHTVVKTSLLVQLAVNARAHTRSLTISRVLEVDCLLNPVSH